MMRSIEMSADMSISRVLPNKFVKIRVLKKSYPGREDVIVVLIKNVTHKIRN